MRDLIFGSAIIFGVIVSPVIILFIVNVVDAHRVKRVEVNSSNWILNDLEEQFEILRHSAVTWRVGQHTCGYMKFYWRDKNRISGLGVDLSKTKAPYHFHRIEKYFGNMNKSPLKKRKKKGIGRMGDLADCRKRFGFGKRIDLLEKLRNSDRLWYIDYEYWLMILDVDQQWVEIVSIGGD